MIWRNTKGVFNIGQKLRELFWHILLIGLVIAMCACFVEKLTNSAKAGKYSVLVLSLMLTFAFKLDIFANTVFAVRQTGVLRLPATLTVHLVTALVIALVSGKIQKRLNKLNLLEFLTKKEK